MLVTATSPPAIYKDLVIACAEFVRRTACSAKEGHIRAFDTKTEKEIDISFNSIQEKGIILAITPLAYKYIGDEIHGVVLALM